MKFKLIFFSLFITLTLFGQRASDGELFFNKKQYTKARSVYESLLNKKPNDGLYNYRYARCCYELKDFETAIVHFEKAGNKYPVRDLYLGELYAKTYRFDESVVAYQTYIATLKPDDSKLTDLQQKVKQAEVGARLLTKVEDITIIDSIVVDKSDFLRAYKLSNELGTLRQEQLKLKGHRNVDKIQYSTQRGDRVYYSDTIQGQTDLFTSYKLFDAWSLPASVSKGINSPDNENYPFLMMDGITMYFASDGENSMGGYDLFITRYMPSTDSFLPPENIGMPFNSPANDYMMVIDEQRKTGWFATDRNMASAKVMIYTFVPNQAKQIVRTGNKDSLLQVAKLKIYRKAIRILKDSSVVKDSILPESEKLIEFVINDSVVYTHLNQFKSEKAIKLWAELHKMTVELKNIQTQLDNSRLQYNSTENQEERTLTATKIIELERKNIELNNLISLKKIEIRNTENNFLHKAL